MKYFFLKGFFEQGNRLKKNPMDQRSNEEYKFLLETLGHVMSGKKGRGQVWLAKQTARTISRISD